MPEQVKSREELEKAERMILVGQGKGKAGVSRHGWLLQEHAWSGPVTGPNLENGQVWGHEKG